jgi:hypothetical protein
VGPKGKKMSFGLLTALSVDDVPKIIRRIANGYRGKDQYRKYPQIWLVIADEFDGFAAQLEVTIAEAKLREPKPKRERIRL